MAFIKSLLLVMITLISVSLLASANGSDDDRKVYIVSLLGEQPGDTLSFHINLLDQILEGSSAKESLVYSYTDIVNGFAANLTEKEVQKLIGMKDKVYLVYPDEELELLTA